MLTRSPPAENPSIRRKSGHSELAQVFAGLLARGVEHELAEAATRGDHHRGAVLHPPIAGDLRLVLERLGAGRLNTWRLQGSARGRGAGSRSEMTARVHPAGAGQGQPMRE